MGKNLRNITDQTLLSETEDLVREERAVTLRVLHHLREIERRQLYAAMAYGSLFEFCVGHLKYSESATQRRIDAMRLLRELPEIEEKIADGELTLSTLSHAQKFFRKEKKCDKPLDLQSKKEILIELEGKSSREAERELLKHSSQPTKLPEEQIRPVSQTLWELKFLADEKLVQDLDQLKGLLAHRFPGMSLADLVRYLADLGLQKLDPAQPSRRERKQKQADPAPAGSVGQESGDLRTSKPKTQFKLQQSHLIRTGPIADIRSSSSVATSAEKTSHSPRATATTRRNLWREALGRCSFIDPKTGRRCTSRYMLEIDHLIPAAHGGDSSDENLRILCR